MHTQVERIDDYMVEVTATGLGAKGDVTTFRLRLSVNEVLLIARAVGLEKRDNPK